MMITKTMTTTTAGTSPLLLVLLSSLPLLLLKVVLVVLVGTTTNPDALRVCAETVPHHHHHHHGHDPQRKDETLVFPPKTSTMCQDRIGVHCQLIAEAQDCHTFTVDGERYRDTVCPVSCTGPCTQQQQQPTMQSAGSQITTNQVCYNFGEERIEVRYYNQEPHHDDWIGIYTATTEDTTTTTTTNNNKLLVGTPVSWFWSCGDKKHKCKTSRGAVIIPWLPAGKYKAVMSRMSDEDNGTASTAVRPDHGPYTSYAESTTFEVSAGDLCTSRRRLQKNMMIIQDKEEEAAVQKYPVLRGRRGKQ